MCSKPCYYTKSCALVCLCLSGCLFLCLSHLVVLGHVTSHICLRCMIGRILTLNPLCIAPNTCNISLILAPLNASRRARHFAYKGVHSEKVDFTGMGYDLVKGMGTASTFSGIGYRSTSQAWGTTFLKGMGTVTFSKEWGKTLN